MMKYLYRLRICNPRVGGLTSQCIHIWLVDIFISLAGNFILI